MSVLLRVAVSPGLLFPGGRGVLQGSLVYVAGLLGPESPEALSVAKLTEARVLLSPRHGAVACWVSAAALVRARAQERAP